MKKSIIQLFSYSVIMLLSMNSVNAQFAGGDGNFNSPYQIATAAQLAKLSQLVLAGTGTYASDFYILTDNIDLKNYQSGEGWAPIGSPGHSFKGSFDGNGKKITGLKINRDGVMYVGLFGYITTEATILRLEIENADILCSNARCAGILVGRVENGLIRSCSTSGKIQGSGTNGVVISVGGIAGFMGNETVINRCFSTATVNAISPTDQSNAGGLVGQLVNSSMSWSYSTGAVSSTSSNNNSPIAGGIAGRVRDGQIFDCAALNPSITCQGKEPNDYGYGRVVGFVEVGGQIILVNNIAFDKMKNPTGGTTWSYKGSEKKDGADINATQINTNGKLNNLFFVTYWTTLDGELPGLHGNTVAIPLHLMCGQGTANDPYLIYGAGLLKSVADAVNAGNTNYNDKYYKLMKDIDLKNYQKDAGWTPIGYFGEDSYFFGHFDGNKKKITGLIINNTTLTHVGLFGYIYGGSIKNLGLENVSISSNLYNNAATGGLAGGLSFNGTISNCYVTGIINSSNTEYTCAAGGIVGYMNVDATISNCYSRTSVNCYSLNSDTQAGGIAGGIGTNCTITNCYSLFDVESHGKWGYAGGIVGFNANGKVANCVALNFGIKCSGTVEENFGRIVGVHYNVNTLDNNIAFAMMYNPDNETTWSNKGLAKIDGADISKNDINKGGTFENRFTASGGWITENGKLPSLFGEVVPMPVYFQLLHPFKFWDYYELWFFTKVIVPDPINWLDKRYILMNDIYCPSNQTWTPIGFGDFPFMGEFDGNGKKIIGLKVAKGEQNQLGLFGFVSGATIKNLGIENLQIEITNPGYYQGQAQIGGIAAYMNNTTMTNCYTTGVINASSMGYMGAVCGGLAGSVEYNTTIKNCYSTAAVTSESDVPALAGGIAGFMSDSEIANSYSTGRVRSSSKSESCSGGVVADISGSAAVRNCAALNPAIDCDGTGTKKYGRIAGRRTGSSTVIANSIAFNKMKNPTGGTTWSNTGLTNTDGADYTAKEVSDSPTLGNRFTDTNGWTSKKGYLPGLFKKEVTMPPYLRFDALPPSIIVQPQNASVAQNYVYYIEVIAQAGDDGALTYQWYKNTTPTNTGGTPVQDATDEAFQPNTETLGTFYYYVEITNTIEDNGNGGNLQEKITSNAMTLTIIPVGINENDNLANILVYPNPTKGMINVQCLMINVQNVEIFDVFGRKAPLSPPKGGKRSFPFGEGWDGAFDISHLPTGVYFVKITTENGMITKKVIKK